MKQQGVRIHVSGIVQGVGFRPFVYNLAMHLGCLGWVRNTSAGVDIELDGPRSELEKFIQALSSEAPALAQIDDISVLWRAPNGFTDFEIVQSETDPSEFIPIAPDVSICDDCLRELFTPVGPAIPLSFYQLYKLRAAFTIIYDIPYDRLRQRWPGLSFAPIALLNIRIRRTDVFTPNQWPARAAAHRSA